MLQQPVELVKYTDGASVTMRAKVDEYGVHIEQSNGGSFRCLAVLKLDEAIQMAKALIAMVEAVEDAEMDAHVEAMAQRYYDRIDAESMALEAEF